MKKTININLGGTFFHIDEDAFAKLNRYLDAIKKSFTDPQGQDEIIRDIEARIAELFAEKRDSVSQVISIKELDEVIAVMGQPEDYMVDEEIFDDAPPKQQRQRQYQQRASYKQLFRDVDNKFISGVAAGLGHYLGIDTIWVRLLWILLTFFSSGFFLVVYILFWILVPAAESTADKLTMQGEAVTIENIEKKIKDEYERVADKVKDVDFDGAAKRAKSGASSFFDGLGSVFSVFFKIIFKFIGIILLITAISTLVSLIVSMFSLGSVSFWGSDLTDYIGVVNTSGAPIWLISISVLLAVGIPFFVLFLLGLKILIPNIKSIGTPAKITLGVAWIAAVIMMGIFAIREVTEISNEGSVKTVNPLAVAVNDTLRLKMVSNEDFEYRANRSGGFEIKRDEDGNRVIYSNDVRLIVRSTSKPEGRISIEKSANSTDYQRSREYAERINYNYELKGNTLYLDGYFLVDVADKYRDQEVEVIVYLPEGSVLFADKNTRSFHSNSSYYDDILTRGDEEYFLRIEKGKTTCLNCPDGRESNYNGDRTTSGWDDDDWSSDDWTDDDWGNSDTWVDDAEQSTEATESEQATSTDSTGTQSAVVNDSISNSSNQ